jgi:hypothetical protein
VNERTTSVLDAIATICAANAKSDVVAVAMKLALPTICFVIAANDEQSWLSYRPIGKYTFIQQGLYHYQPSFNQSEDSGLSINSTKRVQNIQSIKLGVLGLID